MNNTPDLFTAVELRDIGMKMAEDHANEVHENWSERCYKLLIEFIKLTDTSFQTEHFRFYCESKNRLEIPPTKRAYGPVVLRAVKSGLIKRVGYANTSDPRSHGNPKSVWLKV